MAKDAWTGKSNPVFDFECLIAVRLLATEASHVLEGLVAGEWILMNGVVDGRLEEGESFLGLVVHEFLERVFVGR